MDAGFLSIFLIVGGAASGNDLFDYLPLDDFWKQQHVSVSAESMAAILVDSPATDVSELIKQLGSEKFADREKAYSGLKRAGNSILPQIKKAVKETTDVEIRQRLNQIAESIAKLNADRATLRMVALRTIEKRKYKDALPNVRKLTDSPNKLIADYARQTAAALEGKPYKRPAPSTDQLNQDLALLPSDVGIVAQVRAPKSKVEDVFAPLKAFGGLGFPGGGGDIVSKMKAEIVKFAIRSGNIRVDSMTLGVAKDVGRREGYAVFVLRGHYSPDKLLAFMKAERGGRLKKVAVGGMDVWKPDGKVAIICPSNDRLIFIVGASADTLPVSKVVTALKAGAAKPSFSPEIKELVAKVDRTKLAWGVARMNKTYREAPPLQPFDWIVGEVDQDAKGAISFRFKGEGSDAATVKAAIDKSNKELAKGIKQFEALGAVMPMMKPMLDIMKSIKIESKGKQATLTLKVDKISSLLLSPMLMFGFATSERVVPGGIIEGRIEAVIELEIKKPDPVPRRPDPPRRIEKKTTAKPAKRTAPAKALP